MKQVIALDSGSSYMKAYTKDIKVRFPAVTRRLDDQYDHGDTLVLNGQRFAVGESALQTYTDDWEVLEPMTNHGFHGSTEQHAQMCYAFQRLGLENGTYSVLALSLPYADSRHETRRQTLKDRTAYTWTDGAGNVHCVKFEQVVIMPQGVGALCVYEEVNQTRPEALLLVDIGSCTIDMVAMRYSPQSGRYLYLHDKSTSRRTLSTTAFYRRWFGRIRELDGMQHLQKGYFELMNLAQTERPLMLRHGGRLVDITETYDATRRWFGEILWHLLREDMGDKLLGDMEAIIFTGGGALLVDTDVFGDPRVTITSLWDNVVGQFAEASSMGAQAPEPNQTETTLVLAPARERKGGRKVHSKEVRA
jgi:hypothetical protein